MTTTATRTQPARRSRVEKVDQKEVVGKRGENKGGRREGGRGWPRKWPYGRLELLEQTWFLKLIIKHPLWEVEDPTRLEVCYADWSFYEGVERGASEGLSALSSIAVPSDRITGSDPQVFGTAMFPI